MLIADIRRPANLTFPVKNGVRYSPMNDDRMNIHFFSLFLLIYCSPGRNVISGENETVIRDSNLARQRSALPALPAELMTEAQVKNHSPGRVWPFVLLCPPLSSDPAFIMNSILLIKMYL